MGNRSATSQVTYDANGNRASKTLGGVTETYVNDDADKLEYIHVGGTTVKDFSYDTAGRTTSVVTSAGTTSVAYDYEGRITTITYPNLSTNTFAYNGLDTRVSKVDSTGTRTYMRDGAYVTDPVLSDGAAGYTPGISERRSGTTKFYHQDRLGTAERLTNTSQATTDTRQYDAFGLLVASTGSTPTPFGFAGAHGYQEDPDSGLKLLGHRYYDPSTGRFLTRDPAKDGRNWYSYCEGNPSSGVDVTGLWLETLLDVVSFGVSLADFVRDPSRENFGWLLADGAALVLPVVPATGAIRGGARGVDVGAGVGRPGRERPRGRRNLGVERDAHGLPNRGDVQPRPGFGWQGRPGSKPGDKEGSWHNPRTGEVLRENLDHAPPIGPHWDYKDPKGIWWRLFPDGRKEPKKRYRS